MKSFSAFQAARTNLKRKGYLRERAIKIVLASQFVLYQARLIYYWGHSLLLLMAIGAAWLLAQQHQPEVWRPFYHIFEALFPPLAGPLFVPLILKEQHQRTLVLIATTQCSLQILFAVRLLLVIMFLGSLILILGLSLQLAPLAPRILPNIPDPVTTRDLIIWPTDYVGGPNSVFAILLTLGAPTLFVGGTGTMLAHLTADARVGYLTVFALWMFNRAAGATLDTHPVFHYLYLFARSTGTGDWLAPKIVQLVLGTGFFVLSWLLLRKPERFLREPNRSV